MNKETILIVDDDETILRILDLQLAHYGFETLCASTGKEALSLFSSHEEIRLALLDLMLPQIDGLTLCHRFREINPEAKIIIVSARDRSMDVVNGLNSGADDYVKKPFIFDELLARIRANLRKNTPAESGANIIRYKGLAIDNDNFSVTRDGRTIELSKTEYDLLYYLTLNNNLVQSREQILDRVWGVGYYGSNNIVDVYIKYLRDKVDKGFETKLIQTIRGRGYVIR